MTVFSRRSMIGRAARAFAVLVVASILLLLAFSIILYFRGGVTSPFEVFWGILGWARDGGPLQTAFDGFTYQLEAPEGDDLVRCEVRLENVNWYSRSPGSDLVRVTERYVSHFKRAGQKPRYFRRDEGVRLDRQTVARIERAVRRWKGPQVACYGGATRGPFGTAAGAKYPVIRFHPDIRRSGWGGDGPATGATQATRFARPARWRRGSSRI